jgi:hypothetical protein
LLEPDPLHGISPLFSSLTGSDRISAEARTFCFDAFSSREPATRFTRKRDCSRFFGPDFLFCGSIENAAADGKRLRAIDAFERLKIADRTAQKLPKYVARRPY